MSESFRIIGVSYKVYTVLFLLILYHVFAIGTIAGIYALKTGNMSYCIKKQKVIELIYRRMDTNARGRI